MARDGLVVDQRAQPVLRHPAGAQRDLEQAGLRAVEWRIHRVVDHQRVWQVDVRAVHLFQRQRLVQERFVVDDGLQLPAHHFRRGHGLLIDNDAAGGAR
jgi:hypothetical protein